MVRVVVGLFSQGRAIRAVIVLLCRRVSILFPKESNRVQKMLGVLGPWTRHKLPFEHTTRQKSFKQWLLSMTISHHPLLSQRLRP